MAFPFPLKVVVAVVAVVAAVVEIVEVVVVGKCTALGNHSVPSHCHNIHCALRSPCDASHP